MRIDAAKAKEIGLIHDAVPEADLDKVVDEIVQNILCCGPQALKMAKELLERVPGMPAHEYGPYTANMIAQLRTSTEGQEGLSAFLEKRKAKWQEIK